MPKLNRRQLLAMGGSSLLVPLLVGAKQPLGRKLLVVVANGAWDSTFAFDPKNGVSGIDGPAIDTDPGADPRDVETTVDFGNLSISANNARRPNLSALFLAHADKICVVNGLWVGVVTHFGGRTRMLTGTDSTKAPDFATILGVVHGNEAPFGSIDMSGIGRFGDYTDRTIRWGLASQATQLVDPDFRLDAVPGLEPYRAFRFDSTDQGRIDQFLLDEIERSPHLAHPGGERLVGMRKEAYHRAQRMAELEDLPQELVSPLSSQVDTALQMLKSGTTQACMVITSDDFDTHADAIFQHAYWNRLAGDLKYLLDRMVAEDLMNEVTVAVISEFGRTPTRNYRNGTDHWPHTGVMMFGAGVAGNRLCGGTDDGLHSLPMDLETGEALADGETYLRPENFVAGVLEHVDVDPAEWLGAGIAPFRGFRT